MQDLKDLAVQLTERGRAETYKGKKIEWNPSLSVGVIEIDEQHMMLVNKIRELSDVIEIGEDSAVLFETMNFLIEYTDHHFGTEEKRMMEANYPEYNSHKVKHDEFKMSLKGLAQDLIDNGATPELTDKINVFLINWFIDHIQGVDQKLGSYLSENT
jgi:hemerythrin-like metal-binding protein